MIQINWLLPHVLLLAGFLLAVVLTTQILRKRRAPTATLAWLLLIFTIPYLGVPAYLVFGGRKMRRLAGRKDKLQLSGKDIPSPITGTDIEQVLITQNSPAASRGNRVSFHHTGQATYQALVELILAATDSLYITLFILHPDAVGRDILGLLEQRATEGVKVRLLLDGVGSLHTHRRFLKPLQQAGGRYAYFMPVLHRPFRGRTDLRNHRKIIIADETRVLAGGANIAEEYMGPETRPGRWRDLTFTLEGPAVSQYIELFISDWGFASDEWLLARQPQPFSIDTDSVTTQVVPSGPDVSKDPLYDALLTAVFSATERVWIITPYFIPDQALCRALILAVHRGVDIRILLPLHSDHRLADITGRSYLREIQEEGGHILLYRPGMVHAKAMIRDHDIAMVGSANFDMRSLMLNYEVALLIYSEAKNHQLADWMQGLMRESATGIKPIGAIGEIGEGLARLLAPQL